MRFKFFFTFFVLTTQLSLAQNSLQKIEYEKKGSGYQNSGKCFYRNKLSIRSDSSFILSYKNYTNKREDYLLYEEQYEGIWSIKGDTLFCFGKSSSKDLVFLIKRNKLLRIPDGYKKLKVKIKLIPWRRKHHLLKPKERLLH